jgi:hypothetical protein
MSGNESPEDDFSNKRHLRTKCQSRKELHVSKSNWTDTRLQHVKSRKVLTQLLVIDVRIYDLSLTTEEAYPEDGRGCCKLA